MDFTVTIEELSVLSGLSHLQQLLYLRAVRPYMDYRTGLVGIKRGISYQSLAEEYYVEPHQGIRGGSPSKDQLRRALKGLERAGVILIQSTKERLILNCLVARKSFNNQNKAAINPPQVATTIKSQSSLVNTEVFEGEALKATIAKAPKAATPHKENNYIYLLRDFEKFWLLYPEKKSREQALDVFQQINPNQELLQKILGALSKQIKAQSLKSASGQWVPAWKYPANWLSQKMLGR